MPRICFIINSFNRAPLLVESLRSIRPIFADPHLDVSAVIFDAGSTDGSIEIIESLRAELPDRVRVIRSQPGEDSSFAAGLNRACAHRLEQGPVDYFFMFETDNFIDGPQPLCRAISLFESDRDIAAVGFTVKRRDGSPAGFGEPFPTVTSFLLGQQPSHWLRLDVPNVEWRDGRDPIGRYGYAAVVYTSPLLISASAWSRLGGMDATTFPFSDSDLDLAFRIRDAGLRMAVLEETRVFHDNLGNPSEWSASRTLRFHGARYALLARHRTRLMFLMRPALFLRHLVELAALSASATSRRGGKPALRRQLLRCVWSGYT